MFFGKIGGGSAGKYAAANDFSALSDDEITLEETRLNRMIHTEGTRKPAVRETKSEIETLVASAAGVIRNGKDIEAALDRLEEIKTEKSECLAARDFSELN